MSYWTAEIVRSAFVYEPDTGLFFWKVSRGKAKVGDPAGSLKKSTGYLVLSHKSNEILAHRAAWLYVHGELPAGALDHINQVKTDNRIANLRVAEHYENVWNADRQIKAKGTGRQARGGRFYSHIWNRGKRVYLGTFDTEAEAADAYQQAAMRFRGQFLGRPGSESTRPNGQEPSAPAAQERQP